jgi:succinate dehydrogenase/fumarate reductase flavoprotein subunit
MSIKDAADAARSAETAKARRDALIAEKAEVEDRLEAVIKRIESEQAAYVRAVDSLKRAVNEISAIK